MDPRRARSFGAEAEDYDAARPSYPAEAVRWVLPEHAQRVLDLGAGTGKLTRVVLDLGLEAVAVEPDDAMRELIPAEAYAGTAEEIPLSDSSVDAVVVGQAFHWFDAARAVPEMVRVLRPGGTIGLFWNLFDDAVPWVSALVDIWAAEDRASFARLVREPPFGGPAVGVSPAQSRMFEHVQDMDAQLLESNLRSRSEFILMSPTDREAALARARALAPPGQFAMPYVCNAWRATKS